MFLTNKYLLCFRLKIISYYMEKDTRKIKRLRSIPLPKFMPSRVAFLKTADGYHAYVTSKMFQKLLVITYKRGSIDKIKYVLCLIEYLLMMSIIHCNQSVNHSVGSHHHHYCHQ